MSNPNYQILGYINNTEVIGAVILTEPKEMMVNHITRHGYVGDALVINPATGNQYFVNIEALQDLFTRQPAADASVAGLLDGKTIQP